MTSRELFEIGVVMRHQGREKDARAVFSCVAAHGNNPWKSFSLHHLSEMGVGLMDVNDANKFMEENGLSIRKSMYRRFNETVIFRFKIYEILVIALLVLYSATMMLISVYEGAWSYALNMFLLGSMVTLIAGLDYFKRK